MGGYGRQRYQTWSKHKPRKCLGISLYAGPGHWCEKPEAGAIWELSVQKPIFTSDLWVLKLLPF